MSTERSTETSTQRDEQKDEQQILAGTQLSLSVFLGGSKRSFDAGRSSLMEVEKSNAGRGTHNCESQLMRLS